MKEEEISQFFEQHVDTYRRSIIDIIRNNTDVLVQQDILSLLKKPPLDSMDLIRSKFLDLAKKNKIVLNTDALGILLDQYRNSLMGCCDEIKDMRIHELSAKVEKISLVKSTDVIKINKKDFVILNKRIKKLLKDCLANGYKVYILDKIDSIFMDDVDESVKTKIVDEFSKYINGSYQKQILENFELKIMVKDTTLMNSAKEQADHYLFILNNSRLLNEIDT